MTARSQRSRSRALPVKSGGLFRLKDLPALDLDVATLRRLIRSGEVERVARGLYRRLSVAATEHHTLAAVSARVPSAIVCLLSALRVHDIGTQNPHQVWIALPHKARSPHLPEFSLRIVRFSGVALRYGVEPTNFEGVPAHITNPARTVVDCFRFRNKIGVDVALEALRDALQRRKASVDEIMRVAEACRARTVVRRYLEAMP